MSANRSDELFGHPKGLYVCFFTEMWERFSFYGMKALLFLYLTQHHLFGDRISYDVIGAYGGLVYCVPVLGGLLADRYLGMRKAVIFGAILLVLGHIGMGVEGDAASQGAQGVVRDQLSLMVFYGSLALIIMGVGFLKPNISTIVGKLFHLILEHNASPCSIHPNIRMNHLTCILIPSVVKTMRKPHNNQLMENS